MTNTTETEFLRVAEEVKTLKHQPTNEQLLTLYSLYKQSIVGDCNEPRPGMFDLKGKAKHDAWIAHRGMGKDVAMSKYIEFAKGLLMNK